MLKVFFMTYVVAFEEEMQGPQIKRKPEIHLHHKSLTTGEGFEFLKISSLPKGAGEDVNDIIEVGKHAATRSIQLCEDKIEEKASDRNCGFQQAQKEKVIRKCVKYSYVKGLKVYFDFTVTNYFELSKNTLDRLLNCVFEINKYNKAVNRAIKTKSGMNKYKGNRYLAMQDIVIIKYCNKMEALSDKIIGLFKPYDEKNKSVFAVSYQTLKMTLAEKYSSLKKLFILTPGYVSPLMRRFKVCRIRVLKGYLAVLLGWTYEKRELQIFLSSALHKIKNDEDIGKFCGESNYSWNEVYAVFDSVQVGLTEKHITKYLALGLWAYKTKMALSKPYTLGLERHLVEKMTSFKCLKWMQKVV